MGGWTRRERTVVGLVACAVVAGTWFVAPHAYAQSLTALKQEVATAATTDTFAVETSVIRIQLNESHQFGSGLESKDIEQMVEKGKRIPAVCKELKDYGEVAALYTLESPVRLGTTANIHSGGEDPYVTVSPGTGSSSGAQTHSQNVIASGLTAEMTLKPGLPGQIALSYKLHLEDTMRVAVSAGPKSPVDLMRRNRLEWSGVSTIPMDSGVFVIRSLKGTGETACEYYVVLRAIRPAAGESLQILK